MRIVLALSAIFMTSSAISQDLTEAETKIYKQMKQGGLPGEFDKMEIESKWNASEAQYREMLSEYQQGNRFMNHDINIRWRGVPKVFIDVYYDTPEGDLAKKGQVLRFRKRVTLPRNSQLPDGYFPKNWNFTGAPRDFKYLLGSQARGLWIPEWARVQFKEKAKLRGAAWFRYEVGDSLVWENRDRDPKAQDRSAEAARRVIKGEQKHEAMDQMLKHHDASVIKRLRPVSEVTDVRYRVEFIQGERAAYEVSIDRLETKHLAGEKAGMYEIGYEGELEILPVEKTAGSKGITPALVDNLYKMSAKMQNRFKMDPSTASKGGVSAGGAASCDATAAATTSRMLF